MAHFNAGIWGIVWECDSGCFIKYLLLENISK